ncbi:uncharacterized protein EDB93DRAFT_1141174, partial [Suillus bovinus]|uniref:uncharacterized protein n=1 Tax=Suillus bovinus TaxID=48563 RepID=UPI001B87468C
YDKALVPVQVLPRKVSCIVKPETLMACLFLTGEVVCVWSGGVSKISFPTQRFPSEISVYRPPQAIKGQTIIKLRSCDDTIAALSSNGEVFTFTSQPIGESDSAKSSPAFKPQRIWALRRQFSAVQDVDIGADGTVIICTQSGHVYVRLRSAKGGQGPGAKAFKFQRIPYIQRAVAVCANSTGAFGVLRVDFNPLPIIVTARSFSCDITKIQPYLGPSSHSEDLSIQDDIGDLSKLLQVLDQRKNAPDIALPHHADVVVVTPGPLYLPAHRLILAVRCPVLGDMLHTGRPLHDKSSGIEISLVPGDTVHIQIIGCHPFTVLILLRYLYSDQLLAIWDLRIGTPFVSQFQTFSVKPVAIKAELQSLARIFNLQLLLKALQSPGKRVPTPSQSEDFRLLYQRTQLTGRLRHNTKEDSLAPDVALHLADQVVVWSHSVVMVYLSVVIRSGIIDVDLKHLEWADENLLNLLVYFVQGVDDLLSFIISMFIMCGYLLTDATHINATHLVERLQKGHMLEDLDPSIVRQLSEYIRSAQMTKSLVSRSNLLANQALRKHAEWLAQQDIPVIFEPVDRPQVHRDSLKSLTAGSIKTRSISSLSVHAAADPRKATDGGPSGDELFVMDEVPSSDITPNHPVPVAAEPSGPVPVWKRPISAPRLKTPKTSGVANRATRVRESLTQVATLQRRTVGSPKPDASPTPRRTLSDLDSGKSSLPELSATRPVPQAVPSSSKPQPNASSLGPVFSPVRQVPSTSSSPGPRRVSNTGAAWTLPPVQPVVQSSVTESASLSFAEIQQLQLLQGMPAPKDKRSLVEIQEEERAIQLEADFMKWWAAEEARTQEEAHSASQTQIQRATPPRSKNRGGKKQSYNTRSKTGEAHPAQGSSRSKEGGKYSMVPETAGAMPQVGGSSPKSRRRQDAAGSAVHDSIHVQRSKGR